MISIKSVIKCFGIIIFTLFFTIYVSADTQSVELKKVNDQLNSIKKLYDTGVLDDES